MKLLICITLLLTVAPFGIQGVSVYLSKQNCQYFSRDFMTTARKTCTCHIMRNFGQVIHKKNNIVLPFFVCFDTFETDLKHIVKRLHLFALLDVMQEEIDISSRSPQGSRGKSYVTRGRYLVYPMHFLLHSYET